LLSALLREAAAESRNRVFGDSFTTKRGLGAESTLARFGPTTPMQSLTLKKIQLAADQCNDTRVVQVGAAAI
jgi:hypothetical protein